MMKIVIPSHKRPDKVSTTNVVAGVIVCVPASQLDIYKEHNPNTEIIEHPDDIMGISMKRQWIVDYFGDVFMIDDDIKALRRTYLGKGVKKKPFTKNEVRNLLLDTYNMLKEQTEIKLWGFAKSVSPLHFNVSKPIYLSGFIQGGAFGIMKDEDLKFPRLTRFTGEDDYINLCNAFFHRKAWIDKRFFFDFNRNNYNIGGCGDFRTEQVGIDSFRHIKKNFGDAVVLDEKSKNITKWRCKIPF